MRRIGILFVLLFSVSLLFAQPMVENIEPESSVASKRGVVSGRVIEQGSAVSLEYANVAIYSLPDSTLAGGAIAGADGHFEVDGLKPGKYYVDAKFIGYEHTKQGNIEISKENLEVDLGTLELVPASENLQEVSVYAQDKPIVYDIDKKVVDPSQFPTTAGGTATDVLANTPSVVVDIEGNVTMRGSSNFTVLIDGRPTPFDAADALDQVPASTIRNIEIITNPSAKYDPDGNAGIININTKKSKLTGISGIVNATADTRGSMSGDFLLNFKNEKFNFFVNGNLQNRQREGEYSSINKTFETNDTIFTISDGYNNRARKGWSLKTGFDYYINDYNTLTFNIGGNGRTSESDRWSDTHEYSSEYDLKSSTNNLGERNGKELSMSLDYQKKFDNEDQEFTAYLYYEAGNGEDYSLYNRYFGGNADSLIDGQINWEAGDDQEFRFKADYVHPFTDDMKLETGYQLRIDRDDEWNDVHWYSGVDESDYEPSEESDYYSDTYFMRDIHSLYATFSNSGSIVGYQLGLRTEYTNRSLEYSREAEPTTIKRWDFFPTLHLSFQLPAEQQIITSYSRRIDRPRGYYLEPFITYVDAYNVRKGNPGIEPEYIDSYELGYQKQLGKGFASAEIYHRKTNNKIEQLTSVYEGNVMMGIVDNIGEDYSTGLEVMLNTNPTDWWMLNLMGNAYYYKVEGNMYDENVSEESFNWHSRISNTFTITPTTKLQFDAMYHSPSVTAQGTREGFMFSNFAVRQDLLNKKLNLTLSVFDLFNTAKFGHVNEGANFYSSRNFDIKSPVVSLTLSYKINNYRQNRQKGGQGQSGDIMEGGMDGGEF